MAKLIEYFYEIVMEREKKKWLSHWTESGLSISAVMNQRFFEVFHILRKIKWEQNVENNKHYCCYGYPVQFT